MRWPGKGTDGRGAGGAGLARARTGGGRGGARAVAGASAAAADGTTASDTGAAWCYYPERALFVSFGLRLPTSGAVVLWGLHIVPPSAR